MYGLNNIDKDLIDNKLKIQEEYLKNNGLYESSYSPNIRPDKYIPELYNRVNTISKFCLEAELKPIFITITAPSAYHPYSNNLPNPKYNSSNPHETAKFLTSIWGRFLNSNVLSHKCKARKHYFRTYEPHKSGVPHIHALLYVPVEFIPRIKQAFEYQMKKNDIKQYKFIYKFDNDVYKSSDKGAIAYIMKYINKTFKNAKSGIMTDVAYWYAKNKIRRFLTSRSLIPVMVYRKIHYKQEFQDMLQSSKLWLDKSFTKSNGGDIF